LIDFIHSIENALGQKAQLDMLPMQEGDVEVTYASTKKLFEKYLYKPSTNIDEGVLKFVEWYKEFYVTAR
jgi:UDP-glucuronate 4-epimerase